MTTPRMVACAIRCRRGLSLVEAAVSMVIVAVMLAAAIHAAGGSALVHDTAAERAVAAALADGLMAEILARKYQEPDSAISFGPETAYGESATSRFAWDDVDDYNGWTESPPKNKDGTVLPDLASWEWSVSVVWVNVSSPTQESMTETGAKRITVTVRHNGAVAATRVAVRTNAS